MRTYNTLLLIVFLLCAASGAAHAQVRTQPDTYFNDGAYLYTENKTDEALERVKDGLKQYPNNAKLVKLKELLEKQQEQEQQQQQQQQQDQQNQEQQEKDQKDQQNDQNQDKNDKKEQEKDQKDQKNDKKDQKDQKNDQNQQEQQQQPKKAEEMTPEEAEMLLDAMRNDEKAKRDAMRMIMGAPEPPQNGKDW